MASWSPLREVLTHVDSTTTYSWDDLDKLVGGLPRSAYIHNAYWKGARSGWPGFTTTHVTVGKSVTFVRTDARTQRPSKPSSGSVRSVKRSQQGSRPSAAPVRTADRAADLILVGCVKKKLPSPAAAKDLYISPLFRKEREYAERAGVPWFILSAEHGLVDPETVIAPYELRLSEAPSNYRREWGTRVVASLEHSVMLLAGKTIEIHAGTAYTDPIRDQLRRAGATVVEPLAGLPFGARLAWYNEISEAQSKPAAPAILPIDYQANIKPTTNPVEPIPSVTDLVARLSEHERAMSPADFLATGGNGYRSPGIYSWWVDAAGANTLSRGLGHEVSPGLIYAGLAGATRAKSGRKSKNTLWGRIKTMHFGKRHDLSTFRLSLGSILAETKGTTQIDEVDLTEWLHAHLRVIAVPVADADTLGSVETDVLSQLNPPLNLAKVAHDPLRTRLSALRRTYGGTQDGASGKTKG